jgi:hypothetical protein
MEAAFCLVMLLVAFPVAKDISAYYCILLLANLALPSGSAHDSTLIALVFTVIALGSAYLAITYHRLVLLVSAIVAASVAFEQLLNLDTLLDKLAYVDVGITAWLLIVVAMEWRKWAKSRHLL